MLPAEFQVAAEYFIVPVIVLLIAYVVSGQFSLKYSAGTDFFIFFLSADLGAIMSYDELRERINPAFRESYLAVFVTLAALSFLLVAVAGLTQRRIDAWREYRMRIAARDEFEHAWYSSGVGFPLPVVPRLVRANYPLTRVIAAWIATVALLPMHLFVFFGRT
jgi:hypothetical protein